MISYIKIVFLAILLQNVSSEDNEWNYRDFDDWGWISQVCALGARQSPINLKHNAVHNVKTPDGRPLLEFEHHDTIPDDISLINDGFGVTMTGDWKVLPLMSGPYIFVDEFLDLENINIHWSNANDNGTAHSIEGQKYALELHLYYINGKYFTKEEATSAADGNAILAILFEVDDSVEPNPGMKDLASMLGSVQNPGDKVAVTSFNVSSLLPNPELPWYVYDGSLTTPPCCENVRWAVASQPLPINSEIIEAVRKVKLSKDNPHNIRPQHSAFNRLVKLYV